jgi:uncharacterized membrane protein
MSSRTTSVFKSILKYFLQGLVLIAPITITIYILYEVFKMVDGILPIKIPGLGLLAILIIITLVGIIGSTIIAKPILAYYNRLFEKIPIIKILYTSIKDLMSAFVGQKKKFTEPVLVKMSKDSDTEKLGFITEKDLTVLGIEKGKVAVYFPISYNFSGDLFIVPIENVKPIHASPTEIMKFIVSGGVTKLNEIGGEEKVNTD